jgi:hypothetical protein
LKEKQFNKNHTYFQKVLVFKKFVINKLGSRRKGYFPEVGPREKHVAKGSTRYFSLNSFIEEQKT